MSFHDLLDPLVIIQTLGLIGVVLIIFAESGLFFGFFLPGDSLLFTAGFLASQGFLPIGWLLVLCFVAAVLGDNVGYAFGKRVGPAIFTREDSIFFHKKHVLRAKAFYDKYGKRTIVFARFVPIVRTFAPIVAGVGGMNYRDFLKYNLFGGFIWTFSMIGLGFALGSVLPNAEKYMTPIIILIIFISFLPAIIEVWKVNRQDKNKKDKI